MSTHSPVALGTAISILRKPTARLTGRALLALLAVTALAACDGTTLPGAGEGLTSTVAAYTEVPPGTVCTAGGYEIEFGIDENASGLLDPEEVDGTVIICNGADGADGAPGADGSDGAPGTPGTDGQDGAPGFSVVFDVNPELPSSNCAYGGERLDIGLDDGLPTGTPNNGLLETGEINQVRYLCSQGTGISEGSDITPVALTLGEAYHGTVAAASTSYYQFTPTTNGSVSLLGLTRTDSDLRWTLYSDQFINDIASCDNHQGYDADEWCTFPVLTAGQIYYLEVEEGSNIPNLMDVQAGGSMLVTARPDGRLYTVDLDFGDLELLGVSGMTDIAEMTYDFDTGRLLAVREYTQVPGEVRVLDPFADSYPVLALTQSAVPYEVGNANGIAYHPSFQETYFAEESECSALSYFASDLEVFLVDIPNQYEPLPACYSLNSTGFPMAFDGAESFYVIRNEVESHELYTMNQTTHGMGLGSAVFIGTIGFVGFPGLTAPDVILAMAVRPSDGVVYAIVTDEATRAAHYLAVLDWRDSSALTATYLHTFPYPVDGLAFVGGGRPPYPKVSDFLTTPGGVNPSASTTTLTWREYPAAESFNVYWRNGAAGIDPADSGTYTGVLTGIADPVTLIFDFVAQGVPDPTTVYFRVAAVVGGEVVGVSDETYTVFDSSQF